MISVFVFFEFLETQFLIRENYIKLQKTLKNNKLYSLHT